MSTPTNTTSKCRDASSLRKIKGFGENRPMRTKSMNVNRHIYWWHSQTPCRCRSFVEISIRFAITAESLLNPNALTVTSDVGTARLGRTVRLNKIQVNRTPVETESREKGLDWCWWTEIWASEECEHLRSHEKVQLLLMKSVGSRLYSKVRVDQNNNA